MKKNYYKKMLLLLISVFLIGCEEDDLENENPSQQLLTGVFIDSEVSGLRYETESQDGFTNSQGQFLYKEGETISFHIGELLLGTGDANTIMTPISISTSNNPGLESIDVQNIAALLQTLDADNDASNGIIILPEVMDAIEIESIDFSKSIISILGELTASINEQTGLNLQPVYPSIATAHLAETLNEDYETEDLVFKNFIPTIESFSSHPATSTYWVHETDEGGKLKKSSMYERRPNRVLYELEYLNFNEKELPTRYSQSIYTYGVLSIQYEREVLYTDDYQIEGTNQFHQNGNAGTVTKFLNFDEKNRITEIAHFLPNGDFNIRDVFILNSVGNQEKVIRYNSEVDNVEENMVHTLEFEYSEAGEIERETLTNATENFRSYQKEYFYREDNTLEKTIRNSIDRLERSREDVYSYDENEIVSHIIITVGEYITEYVSFYEYGEPHIAETSYQGFLYEIVTWNRDRSSEWKIIDQDQSYRIEYKDVAGTILKTEYYDAEGNLLRTEP